MSESMLEVYVFENLQLLEQLEGFLLAAEKKDQFSEDEVGAIFRILHTIKGSSAMMEYDRLAKLSHSMEDLFGFIRENAEYRYDHRKVCDLVFSAQDFLRNEIEKLQDGGVTDGDPAELFGQIREYYAQLKAEASGASPETDEQGGSGTEQETADEAPKYTGGSGIFKFYKIEVRFDSDCKMENIRAFGVIKSVEEFCRRIVTIPEDVLSDQTDDFIVANGFTMFLESDVEAELLKEKAAKNLFVASLEMEEISDLNGTPLDRRTKMGSAPAAAQQQEAQGATQQQKTNYMSVRLDKLDKLMDLIGEIVITEATVTKNPDLIGLQLDSFSKAARQLRKLTDELQDTVMSIRMMPISATFHKLERIVRDMSKKTKKQAELVIIGEDTEMDKNVIDNLSDPLMHIVRNSMDHGLEPAQEREAAGKHRIGKITLEARNTGGDIMINVSDDGRGLNRDVLIQKGIEKGIVKKAPEEVTDREAYALIFAAGFSTKEAVTEFSGRGVGMDVAVKNIQKMGGSISIDSTLGKGMTVQLRIPLTLAIIDGMQVSVGDSVFIVPLLNIKESFKPKAGDVFTDPAGNEMIMIRDNCHSVLRLHKLLGIDTEVTNLEDGILLLIESDRDSYCMFVDNLIGEQQTVIKPMPYYISRSSTWLKGVAGCTIMGDGSISLILDINSLVGE